MNQNNIIACIIVGIIFGVFASTFRSNKYQVSSFGNNGAIVVDQYSGEAWITDSYVEYVGRPGEKTVFYLKPISYCGSQIHDWAYTPDERRNDKNTSWWIWLKRKFSK